MATEEEIIDEVVSLLGNIDPATSEVPAYNYAPGFVIKAPIYPADIDSQSQNVGLYVTFGDGGQSTDRFVDVPRLGKVTQMIPVLITAVVKEQDTDPITTLSARVLQDIRRAIGDNLRANLADVFHVQFGAPSSLRRYTATRNDVLEIPINVWFKWDQREIVSIAKTGLNAALNLDITIASGQLRATFTTPAAATNLRIYKNDFETPHVTLAQTVTEWFDPDWIIGESENFYQFESIDGVGGSVKTAVLGDPYYPNTEPLVNHYRMAWELGAQKLGKFTLGDSSPEMLLEHQIRLTFEQNRRDGGILSDVVTTSAGQLVDEYMDFTLMPLLHVRAVFSDYDRDNTQSDLISVDFLIDVFAPAENADDDRIDNSQIVNRIIHHVREIAVRDYAWSGRIGAVNTEIGRTELARDTVAIGSLLLFHAMQAFTVVFYWPWRD